MRLGGFAIERLHSLTKQDSHENFIRDDAEKRFQEHARKFTKRWRDSFDESETKELSMRAKEFGVSARLSKSAVAMDGAGLEAKPVRWVTWIDLDIASQDGLLTRLGVVTHSNTVSDEGAFKAKVFMFDSQTDEAAGISGVLGSKKAQTDMYEVAIKAMSEINAWCPIETP
jgi:hypothetical protein